MKNDMVIEAYEAIFKRVSVNIDTGEVTWAKRPLSDFATRGRHAQWHRDTSGKPVGYKNGSRSGRGVKFRGVNLSVARIVARARWGKKSYSKFLSYADGDPWNLSKDNLSLVAWAERRRKAPGTNQFGYTGVSVGNGPGYIATCVFMGVKHHLGTYPTPEEAGEAYQAFQRKVGRA